MVTFDYFHVSEPWYKEKELVNNTSGPDNTVVSLPRDVCNLERDLYSCSSANPVRRQTALPDVTHLYSHYDDMHSTIQSVVQYINHKGNQAVDYYRQMRH